ncbi:MAG TPA: hypothetical protein VJ798_05750 [Rhizomicrobium sp.]|nr:hypothetical protein [Rhizomicrobium sp.]
MPPDHPLAPFLPFLPFLILIPILYFRMRKLARPQPLKLTRLWIRPVVLGLVAALVLWSPVPGVSRTFTLSEWAILVVAGVLGAVAGWYSARSMKIEVHPEDGTLMVQGGQAAVLIMLALILGRSGLNTGMRLEGWHLDVLLITDALIVFTAALFTARSTEMYLRARRVMDAAKS